ncbi:helix-turn-helix transcriptional regulator [Caloramator sp. CAR-1]|uniref:helix-turn-helix domain-containing protein n=1 Tax=Caloramator sp. CAR-1 TaxID=3062777 RepID=UPI0026E244D2|nr:helix-turn-helix transcriptional regulator [Caloramator sp. CAR-1]MDO6353976.1 helix-turn-helix transcriptional regulator [Caloramator sp. CAR-1]
MKIKLRQLREKRNMTQRQLALRSGVAVGYINELEQGKYNNPGAEVLCKLAKALRCTIDDLVECDDDESTKS